MRDEKKARVIEIFSSIQGEGLYVGQRQIFIRFAECNLKCVYCDLPLNPRVTQLSCKEVLDNFRRLDRLSKNQKGRVLRTYPRVPVSDRPQVVSLTGGEPLCQVDFLVVLLPELKKSGYRLYLETNGTLAGPLARIINWIDIISMDLKLPSATRCRPYWDQHAQFLESIREYNLSNLKIIHSVKKKITVFIKVVVTPRTEDADLKKAVDLVRKIDYKIPFVIQPVWPASSKKKTKKKSKIDGKKKKISYERLLEFETLASRYLEYVRVIPQVHKVLGCR